MKGFILLLTFFLSHLAMAQNQSLFKLMEATSTEFSGGMPQNGWGISYCLTLKVLTGQKIEFQEMWVGGDKYGIVNCSERGIANPEIKKGDTVYVSYTFHQYPGYRPGKADSFFGTVAYKTKPYVFRGAALLGYRADSKQGYYVVSVFRNLPAQNYP